VKAALTRRILKAQSSGVPRFNKYRCGVAAILAVAVLPACLAAAAAGPERGTRVDEERVPAGKAAGPERDSGVDAASIPAKPAGSNVAGRVDLATPCLDPPYELEICQPCREPWTKPIPYFVRGTKGVGIRR